MSPLEKTEDDELLDAEVEPSPDAGPTHVAGMREAGALCPLCGAVIAAGTDIESCKKCGKPHHFACWSRAGGCGSYACAPLRRELRAAEERLVISTEEIDQAVPLVARKPKPNGVTFSGFTDARPRTSRMAVASLITALAGIPLFGIVTGLVAVVMACFALGGIQHSGGRVKGLGFALGGLLLGLADAAGWLVFIAIALGPGFGGERHVDVRGVEETDIDAIEHSQPEVARAMRANVLVRHDAWMGEASGSGVVMRMDNNDALVVTNRHVVDNDFPGRTDPPDLDKLSGGKLRVRMFGGEPQPARVVWVAPDGVDLALLKVKVDGVKIQPAPWESSHTIRVGERVFAIGNPFELNWTYTDGVVSQLRNMRMGTRRLRVIQTQASVNPGNSGGGLYDEKGTLIGIITWTHDKRTSEGLGFAINLDVLIELAPDELLKPAIPFLSAQPES